MPEENLKSQLSSFPALRVAPPVDEGRRISRFLAKLLGEALHLGAESITFVAKNDCCIQFWRGEQEMLARQFGSAWFPKIVAHVLRCDLPALCNARRQWSEISAEMGSAKLTGAARLPSQIVSFAAALKSVEGQGSSLTLSRFRAFSSGVMMAEMGFSDDHRSLMDSIVSGPPGLLVVCAPNPTDLADTIATALALTGGAYLGDMRGVDNRESFFHRPSTFGVAAFLCNDPIQALAILRDEARLEDLELRGIFSQVLAAKNCSFCSAEVPMRDVLPAWFTEQPLVSHRVGKGCPACNQVGVKGYIGIQSIVQVDKDLLDLAVSGAPIQALADLATGRGSRPLVDDATRKLRDGQIGLSTASSLGLEAPIYKVRVSSRRSMFPSGEVMPPQSSGELGPVAHEDDEGTAVKSVPSEHRYSLLVVEDDPDQRSILEMVLRSANYDVKLASSGLEALETLQTFRPDAIISDLMMPEMDGGELVGALKAHPEHARIPVLILTVVADAEREFQLLDLGADDYCEKSVQRKIFLKRVEHLVKRKASTIAG